ncbi:multi-sensor signal transduction histidine kinase [Salegentibacter sp. 24]|uniref:ATP-binding protein n=1 Tax=Salegentibacter sp. 24 TaxID=2183986 RepID=UPI00105D6F0E|nr:ATP-binding protein [Salegentibacter sp. 24]TDN87982.1 multi-sensor signal transduction histidine kinase [Salegentibacter sp. 24]
MSSGQLSYPGKVDILNCEKEPIHLIGKVQAHGVILAVHPETFKIIQASENTTKFFGISYTSLIGDALEDLIGKTAFEQFRNTSLRNSIFKAQELKIGNKYFVMLPHFTASNLIIDFEVLGEVWDPMIWQEKLSSIITRFDKGKTVLELCRTAAILTKEIFGYHRVMVYRFDEDWNGEVVAEQKEEHLESWLGLHYPASDIPSQSRKLFLKNKVRIISDVNYEPVSISPEISPYTNNPLDLSRSELRAVSPIHIEYLQNMKVGASLTTAIIVNDELWGLITCHHYSAKFINYFQRETFKFLTQILSNRISSIQTGIFNKKFSENSQVKEKILKDLDLGSPLFYELNKAEIPLTSLINSAGVAVIFGEEIGLMGDTPTKTQVMDLCDFLTQNKEPIFQTKSLKKIYPKAKSYQKCASGILSLKLGKLLDSFVIWFRPEIAETVSWGGNPEKKVFFNSSKQRLSPRKSFEKWTEKLNGISNPWKDYEIETAKSFRESLNQVILKQQKEEIVRLNQNLQESNKDLELFSYGISHDLRAPLRGISGYAQMIKEDYSQELSTEVIESLDTMLKTSQKMEEMIDDILTFSKMTKGKPQRKILNTNKLLEEILFSFNLGINFTNTKLEVASKLLETNGDRRMLLQLWSNLLSNALKYSEHAENPKVEIGSFPKDTKNVFYIKDNGTGIADVDRKKIFKLFSRSSKNSFKGTGIGLAIVARIIEKHNGEIWIESTPGSGSTFFFHL